MITLDIFKGDAFTATSLSAFVEKKPYIPSMLRNMGLFEVSPVRTTTIWLEFKDGKIALIPTTKRGAPVFQNEKQKRRAVPLETLRLAKGDRITASELQDIRAEGEAEILKEVQMEISKRIDQMTGDIDLTEENLMLGAIQGILVDADGSTVIYNLFDELGVTQPAEIDFDLDNATPAEGALRKKCNEVIRGMSTAGQGAFLPGTEIVALAGDAFWDDLTTHQEVRETYKNWQQAESLRNDVGAAYQEFRFGNIIWINYRGTDDGSTVAVGTDKVKFFPRGARNVFKIAYAPAESFEFVNTNGQSRYSNMVLDKDRNEWADVEVKSYPLPYCTRPEMLFRGRRT